MRHAILSTILGAALACTACASSAGQSEGFRKVVQVGCPVARAMCSAVDLACGIGANVSAERDTSGGEE